MKYEREVYIDLIGRWLHGSDGFIERLDIDREYSNTEDALNIWVHGRVVDKVRIIESIENNRVNFGYGIWIDLNDDRKEMKALHKSCINCLSRCKRSEICAFFNEGNVSHNYNEVHKWMLSHDTPYIEDMLAYWWDVPDE